jgi:O-antigen/teichoic acid export membrane protein
LWPAYREAMVRGDMEWTRRTLRRSIQIAVGYAAALSIPLAFAAPWIIRHWVNGAVEPPFLLILGLGIWKIMEAAAMALSMFFNGAQVVKPQVWIATATAAVAITLQLFLLPLIGVAGAVWATIVAATICAFIPYAVILPRTIRALSRH